MADHSKLPYWHFNVPVEERTDECPVGLRDLEASDIEHLGRPNAEYTDLSWQDLKDLIKANDLAALKRRPSVLREYRIVTHGLKQEYGSILNFLVAKRLGWGGLLEPRGRPFEHEEDLKTLHNDWAYGIDDRIVHLLVWTKFAFDEDPRTGDLTDEARASIEDYVNRTFRSRMPADNVRTRSQRQNPSV